MSINLDLAKRPRSGGALLNTQFTFQAGNRQLKALMFVGAGIEDHQRTRTETFDLADGMLAKPTTIV